MAGTKHASLDGLRVLWAIVRARLLRRPFPLAVIWNVTYRCNCRCQYCSSADLPGGELSAGEGAGLIDALADMGTRWLTFSGGEPLLRADLGDLVGRAADRGLHVRVSSNAILVPGRIAALRRVDAVSVSLDGPEEVHDLLRGAGTFRGAMAGIAALRGEGIAVNLKCTLNRHNLQTTDELLAIASGLGLPVMFQPATTWINFGAEADPVAADVEAYRRTIGQLLGRKRAGAAILNSAAGLRYLARWPEAADIPCQAGVLMAHIQPDGSMSACSSFQGAWTLGRDLTGVPAPERFRAARASRFNCRQCWCAPSVEFNLMMSLRPGPVFNAIRMGL